MTAILLSGYPVLSASVTAPRVGCWTAEVQIAGEVQLSGSVNLGGWAGSVVTGGPFAGRSHYLIVGGAGGLGRVLDPKHHRSATVAQVLDGICSASGESRSLTIDPSLTLSTLSFWTRVAGSGGSAVSTLASHLGANWRILPDGKVWLGLPGASFRPPEQVPVLDHDPIDRSYEIAPDSLSLWVGMSQDSGTIQRIEYTLSDTLRARYWVD